VRVVRTPPSAPNCNAYAERFVRSVKEESLDRIVPLGERHLRRTLQEFAAHYHRERNHQGLANELIERPSAPRVAGAVRRRQRVGGILNFYYRSAA
jgi:putative transposase